MFTGLVQAMGRVAGVEGREGSTRIMIDAGGWDHRPAPGDSVCVSGCCLTLVESSSPGLLAFDAIPETLAKTTLASWREGWRVNLEHSARMDTLIGGHVVQGHVDGVGEVVSVKTEGEWRVRVRLDPGLAAYIVPKGSVSVDGVSLTIAAEDAEESWFEVALIPETLERTTLGELKAGDRVNIECDIMAKTVAHQLRLYMERGESAPG